MRIHLPLAAALLAAGCATDGPNRLFDATVANGAPHPAIAPRDPDALRRDAVDGARPPAVTLKTSVQSICRGWEFVVEDGRILAKRAGDPPTAWRPLLGTGLPHGPRGFRKAPRSGPRRLWEKSLGRPVSANRISRPSAERK